jgi:hypothetical protein
MKMILPPFIKLTKRFFGGEVAIDTNRSFHRYLHIG